jgi:hypothetical protein
VRALADAPRIQRFMRSLGAAAEDEATVYLTGGATAVLVGWRTSTIDIDLALVPEHESLLRALARLKDELQVNVELASPADFVPVAPGWEERSPFVAREGRVTFRHFDPNAQILAKIERGHVQDLEDVRAMVERGVADAATALAQFEQIEDQLYRFPAIDRDTFSRRVHQILGAA